MTDTMKPLFDLRGKVALITGGNGGIGLGFARGIARCGGDIVIWGRNAGKNAAATAELEGLGVRVRAYVVDVAKEDQVVAGMKAAVNDMGRLDCVVANSGYATSSQSFVTMPSSKFRDLFEVNLHGAILTLREGARHMAERAAQGDAGGSLIVVGSMTTIRGTAGMQHYAAAKGALASVMRCTAVELGPNRIRANMVVPGFIVTDLTTGGSLRGSDLAKQLESTMAEKAPLRRVGDPSDFEGIAAYLASDASSFHTGDVIVIDGGRAASS